MKLSSSTRNLFRYGLFLILTLITVFSIGLFFMLRNTHRLYVDSYLRLLEDHYRNILASATSNRISDPQLIVKELDKHFVEKHSKINFSNLITAKSFPALVGGFSGIFAKGNSAKFIFEKQDGYIYLELTQEYINEHSHGRTATVVLFNSDNGIIVLSSVPEYVGKHLKKQKGLLTINGTIGYVEVTNTLVQNAKLALFVPLTTYLVDLAPYIAISVVGLVGAAIWLSRMSWFERKLIGSITLIVDVTNKAAAEALKGRETNFTPIKTEIDELNQLQESMANLLEVEKASQAEIHGMMESLQDTVNELEETKRVLEERNIQIISSLAEAIEIKDIGTRGHSDRTVTLALELAKELGVTDPVDIEAIKFGALLHDVGKIGIPEHILNKAGRLTPEEFQTMKMHPIYGEKIVKNISGWDLVADIVRHHHENIDGSGYPDGLAGDQISLRAQIVAIVDVFTALIEDRPYRRALPISEAIKIIETEMLNKKFSPQVYEAFKRVLQRLLREENLSLLE